MGQYTYYFNQTKDKKQFYSLLNSELFQQIIDFFIENQNERIILRQLKKSIKTEGNLELFLDKMIQFKLISRSDRQYSLSFPVYDLADYSLSLPKNLKNYLEALKQEDADYLTGFIGEFLWSECETKDEYFFGVKSNINYTSFYEKRIMGDSELTMVAIQDRVDILMNIPTYFNLLSLNKLPKQYKQLEELLGDVNQEYFLAQTKSLIQKAQKSRNNNSSNRDIFKESLLLTNNLTDINEKLALAKPIIKKSSLWQDNQNSQPIIKLLNELWDSHDSINKQTFIKKLVFSKLMNYIFYEKKELTYFLI